MTAFLISQKSFNQGYKSTITIANFLVHKEMPAKEIPTPLEIITKKIIIQSPEERNITTRIKSRPYSLDYPPHVVGKFNTL